jgi:hypothetical protein
VLGEPRSGPPEDFIAFVERRSGDLATAEPDAGPESEPHAGSPTRDRRLTAAQRAEVLDALARRWWWLRVRARWLGQTEAADDLLDQLLAEHLAHWDPTAASLIVGAPRPGTRAATVLERPLSVVDLAEVAWVDASRSRRRRGGVAVGVALLTGLLLISVPRHSDLDATPTGPPAVAEVTVRPPLTDVVPAPDRLAALPVMSVPGLPGPRIDLGTPASVSDPPAKLSVAPVRRVTAAFQPENSATVYVLGDDGTLRMVDAPVPLSARLTSTSLSPDGLRLALLTGNQLIVVSLPTRTVNSYPVHGIPVVAAAAWVGPTTVAVSDDTNTLDVELTTGAVTYTNFAGGDLLQAQPPGPLAELVSVDDPPTTSARIRHWSGDAAQVTPLTAGPGMSLSWLGAWQGPGWQRDGMLVREAATSGLALPEADSAAGVAAAATLLVDEATGAVRRVLAYPADQVALAVLGFLDPQTVLLRTGDGTSFGILAWTWGTGDLRLVTKLSRVAVVSLALR